MAKTVVVVETVIDGEVEVLSVGVVVKGVAEEGEAVTVSLHDGNGVPCLITGKVVEVISKEDY